MDWTNVIIAVISAVLGGGGMSAFLMLKENKKAKRVETDLAFADGLQIRIKHLEEQLDKKDAKIDTLYAEKDELRNENDRLSTEVAVLKVYKCVKVGCADRQPPFGTFNPDTIIPFNPHKDRRNEDNPQRHHPI